jgi:hypothetical protein
MLTTRDHDVADYAALCDMDTTDVALLDEADRACLDELGRYLVSNDSWWRFSIWLLHKHFEPSAGELFVERVSSAPRGTETRPVQRRRVDLEATSVRFDPEVCSGVGLIGMEYADPSNLGCTAPMGGDDEAVLAGVAKRLRAQEKTERFGVRLIRNPLGLRDDEVLVENCDIAHRRLHCSVEKRAGVHPNSIETTWNWRPGGSGAMQYCSMMCGYDGNGNHYIEGHTTTPD